MSSPRLKPSVRSALILVVLYAAAVVAVAASSSTNYNDWFDSAHNTWRTPVPMLYVGWVAILGFLAYAKWGMTVFRDTQRLPMPRVLWIPVIVMVVGIVLRFIGEPWGDVSGSFFLAVLLVGIGVGFAEETVFRGVLLRGLRDGVRPEYQVAFLSSGIFGLFHLTNILFGGPVLSTLGQVVLAGLSGVTFYLVRRGTGALVPAMVMHGLFDMSLFLQGGGTPDNAISAIGYAVVIVSYALGVWALLWLRKHDRETVMTPVEG